MTKGALFINQTRCNTWVKLPIKLELNEVSSGKERLSVSQSDEGRNTKKIRYWKKNGIKMRKVRDIVRENHFRGQERKKHK